MEYLQPYSQWVRKNRRWEEAAGVTNRFGDFIPTIWKDNELCIMDSPAMDLFTDNRPGRAVQSVDGHVLYRDIFKPEVIVLATEPADVPSPQDLGQMIIRYEYFNERATILGVGCVGDLYFIADNFELFHPFTAFVTNTPNNGNVPKGLIKKNGISKITQELKVQVVTVSKGKVMVGGQSFNSFIDQRVYVLLGNPYMGGLQGVPKEKLS